MSPWTHTKYTNAPLVISVCNHLHVLCIKYFVPILVWSTENDKVNLLVAAQFERWRIHEGIRSGLFLTFPPNFFHPHLHSLGCCYA